MSSSSAFRQIRFDSGLPVHLLSLAKDLRFDSERDFPLPLGHNLQLSSAEMRKHEHVPRIAVALTAGCCPTRKLSPNWLTPWANRLKV